MFATQSMLVHVTVLIRILPTSDLIDVILAADDVVNLQRLELLSYLTQSIQPTFVITTISSRGRLSLLIALPRMTSE